jgi:hypothetical protein
MGRCRAAFAACRVPLELRQLLLLATAWTEALGAQGRTAHQKQTAACESTAYALSFARGAGWGTLQLTLSEWCERFAGCCMADDSCSHLQPVHNSSSRRHQLPVRAPYSTYVCIGCARLPGLVLLRCLCALRGSLNLCGRGRRRSSQIAARWMHALQLQDSHEIDISKQVG